MILNESLNLPTQKRKRIKDQVENNRTDFMHIATFLIKIYCYFEQFK